MSLQGTLKTLSGCYTEESGGQKTKGGSGQRLSYPWNDGSCHSFLVLSKYNQELTQKTMLQELHLQHLIKISWGK